MAERRTMRMRRPVAALLLGAAAVGLAATAHADEDRDVTIDRQGDAYVSPLPATYTPSPRMMYVALVGGTEESRAYVHLDLSSLDDGSLQGLRLSLKEGVVDTGHAIRPETASLRACPIDGTFVAGRQPAEAQPQATVRCPEEDILGTRDDTGRWLFDLGPLVRNGPAGVDDGVAIVAVTSPGATWRVPFDMAASQATAQVAPQSGGSSTTTTVDDVLLPGPSGQPPLSDFPSAPSGPFLPPTAGGTTSGPSAGPPAPFPSSGTGDDGEASNGRWPNVLLVLLPVLAAAVAFAPDPRVLHRLQLLRSKEETVSLDSLPSLNRSVRLGLMGAVGLAVIVLASVTSSPTGTTGGGDLFAGPLSADGEGPGAGDSGVTATGDGTTGPGVTATGGAGGPGGPGSSSSGPGRTTGTTPGSTGGAGNRGPIKIAYLHTDPGQAARFGLADSKLNEVAVAIADEINARGGVHGRKIQMDVITIKDPTNHNEIQQACRTAFVDHRVDMFVNDQAHPGLARCAHSYGKPITAAGFGTQTSTTAAELAELGGMFWIAAASSDRFVNQFADMLAEHYGNDTKIGIINHFDENLVKVGRQFTAAIQARGFPPPSYYQHTADPSTAAIQTANAINQFKQAGVQLVVPITNSAVVGMGQRGFTANNYRPEKGWTFSSLAFQDYPEATSLYDPSQMNGAKGASWVRLPDEPELKGCRDIVARRAPSAPWTTGAGLLCHMLFQNHEVLLGAGGDPAAAIWALSYSRLSFRGPFTGAQSYSRTKRDGADQYRVLEFRDGKFTPVSGWRN